MKYLPLHLAMVSSLQLGMRLHNHKAWTINNILSRKPFQAICICGTATQLIVESDLSQFAISCSDIAKLRPFKGQHYISKYSDFVSRSAHIARNISHHDMKQAVDTPEPEPLSYLPINEDFLPHLRKGMRVLMSGGKYCGGTYTITALNHRRTFDHTGTTGVELNHFGFAYSQEWFAANVYVATVDIARMEGGAEYVDKFKAHAVTSLAKKGPDYAELALMDYEKLEDDYKAHTFSLDSKGSWLACVRASTKATHLLEADTESGLKAKIALEFAKDPNLVFEVYTKVGEAKAKTVTHKVLAFFGLGA